MLTHEQIQGARQRAAKLLENAGIITAGQSVTRRGKELFGAPVLAGVVTIRFFVLGLDCERCHGFEG